jgi:hypothetical protein
MKIRLQAAEAGYFAMFENYNGRLEDNSSFTYFTCT